MGLVPYCIVTEEFGWGCAGINTSLTITALSNQPLIIAGSDEQQKKYLGRMTEQPLSSVSTS